MIAAGFNLLGNVKGAQQQYQAPKVTAAETAKLQALSNINRLLQAYANPEDVISRNLRASDEQAIRQASARAISDLERAQRRSGGRVQYFNPERRDEAITSFMQQQAQAAGPQARASAMDRIMGLIRGYQGQASDYGSLMLPQQDRLNEAQRRNISKYGATADVIRDAGDFLGTFSGTSMSGGMQGPTQGSGAIGNIYSLLRSFA